MSHAENPLLAAALDYAGRGWRVVPLHQCVADDRRTDGEIGCSCGNPECRSQGKHPRFNAWQKEATADGEQVRIWWKRWPGANVGVALGPESGIVAIDVDTRAGEQLIKELAGGDVARTVLFRTGKGHRLLYAVPPDLPAPPVTRVVQIGGVEAVRFQSTGGQCVMPPSCHPDGFQEGGHHYEWVPERDPASRPVAPMPEWLVAEMCRPKSPEWSDPGARDAFLEGKDFNTAADWFRDVLEPAGFKPFGQAGAVMRFTRPGKASGISVTVGHYQARDGSPALYVFSGSIPGLDAGKCYDKFGAFAKLHHRGDFAAASAAVAAKGYGRPARPKAAAENAPEAPKHEPWGDPPLPLDSGGEVAPFPLDALPEWLAETCERIAKAVPCPVDYPATFALGIAAGTIGSTIALKIKGKWIERAVMYCCVVARPNDGKSPALDPLMDPVVDEHAKRVNDGSAGTDPAYVSDVTVESLATILQSCPRGLLLVRDELAGWVASMDQYKAKGAGADRQFWLQNWTGTSINVRRKDKDRPALFVRHPAVTLVGGVQPAVLDQLRGQDDGFFDRILFSYAVPLPAAEENWDAIDDDDLKEWRGHLNYLRERALTSDPRGDRPWLVHMDAGAEAEWQAFSRWRAERLNDPELPEPLRGPVGKLSNYAARLALTVYALRHAIKDTEQLPALGAREMAAGAALARYFYSHGTKVFRAANRDERLALARKIVAYLERNRVEKFTRRDAHRALFGSVDKPEDLIAPLKLLEQLRYVRYADAPYAGVGRRPSPVYEVNPALHRKQDGPEDE